MGAVAAAAGVSRSSLSNHIVGRRRNPHVQYRVWSAFRRLAHDTGIPVRDLPGMADFWGDLLVEGKP